MTSFPDKTRVAVVGASGKMGRVACRAIRQAEDLELVAEIRRGENLEDCLQLNKVEIAVDLTAPEIIDSHLQIYFNCQVHPVIGTTGCSPKLLKQLQNSAAQQSFGGLIAPNFAIGAILMMQFSRLAAQFMPQSEIIEFHHPDKKDAPSGTALLTQALMRDSTGAPPPIHSVRLEGFLAHQEVIFGQQGQRLSIRHDSIDRECFMPGILLGIRKVRGLPGLVVGLEHCMELQF